MHKKPSYKDKEKKYVASVSFDLTTFGLWAQHASTAPTRFCTPQYFFAFGFAFYRTILDPVSTVVEQKRLKFHPHRKNKEENKDNLHPHSSVLEKRLNYND